ncbi:T3SS effector HopA1 family protein [Streptomyces xanthophaeus]
MTHETLDPRVVRVWQSVELSADLREALVGRRILTADSERALRTKVWQAVYETFHVGLELPGSEAGTRWSGGPDPTLVEEYSQQVPHMRSEVIGTVVGRTPAWTVAELNGVRVRFPAAAGEPRSRGETAVFDVASRRPAVSPGFFAVTGSSGPALRGPVLRVYVNAGSPETAVAIWGVSLRYLEDRRAGYQAKAASHPKSLARRDSVVIYLDAGSLPLLSGLVDAISRQGPSPSVPFFTRALAPGIAFAWEPRTVASAPASFGQHRATVITDAIFEFRTSPDGRFERTAREHLEKAFVDPQNIHRNVDSPQLELSNTPS